ncbi:MAG TPA: helix-turn-helix domain-containing protein [Pyrinomonadaceae bacterium]|nr:helix-turn-helix domain-containing protein [Pyrinomonadaceae bacterium]
MDRRVQTVIVWMHDNLHRDVSIEELARLVNLSSSRLRHVFKVETNVSLYHYLKLLRMKRAKDLLATTLLTVKEVRVSVGVQNKAHFTQYFKETYGMTPVQFRRTLDMTQPPEKYLIDK